jgi:hypothetical protein
VGTEKSFESLKQNLKPAVKIDFAHAHRNSKQNVPIILINLQYCLISMKKLH